MVVRAMADGEYDVIEALEIVSKWETNKGMDGRFWLAMHA